MNNTRILTVTSFISLLLFTLHLADDIVRGFEPGTLTNLWALPIFVVWLYGTLALAERRTGLIIILAASLLSLAVPFLHMRGKGVGINSDIADSDGAFFFVWTLIALGTTALFSVILSVRELFRNRRNKKSVTETTTFQPESKSEPG